MKKFVFISFLMMFAIVLCFADNSNWTFNTDLEGWETTGNWASTVEHSASEGHDATGSVRVTDTNDWYGIRNTATVGVGNPAYTLKAWAKLISTAPGVNGGLNLATYGLAAGDPFVAFDAATTNSWQMQSITGNALTGGMGYIMIDAGEWGTADPATVDFYVDDVSYTEGAGVTDWALFKE